MAQSHTPSDHCVRFAPAVADDRATLASRRRATTLPVPVFHRQDRVSFARTAITAALIWCQQRASRRWLIGRAENRTYCKIMIIWRLSALDLVARNIWTARGFYPGEICFSRNFAYSRQMPLQTNCARFEGRREPRRLVRRILNRTSRDRRRRGSCLVRLFKTAKLRCGCPRYSRDRSSGG